MTSRSDEHPVDLPLGEDPNPTSVNIAEYERLAAERKAADKAEKSTATTKKTSADKR